MIVYCVWAWDAYYPNGGNRNLKGIYATYEAAKQALDKIVTYGDDTPALDKVNPYDYKELTAESVIGTE